MNSGMRKTILVNLDQMFRKCGILLFMAVRHPDGRVIPTGVTDFGNIEAMCLAEMMLMVGMIQDSIDDYVDQLFALAQKKSPELTREKFVKTIREITTRAKVAKRG